jgi:hypothetical protein
MPRGHVACQRGGRRRVLSAINGEAARLYGPYVRLSPLSRATSHAAAAGLRLSGKRRARAGHVPAPDPYSCRGPPGPGTLPRPGPYSEGPGAYPRDPACPLGSSKPVRTGVRCPSVEVRTYRCTLGSIIFPCHVVLLDLPMWWGRVPEREMCPWAISKYFGD